MTTPKRILYVHYGDNWIRGSEVVLLDLILVSTETSSSQLSGRTANL